MTDNNTILTERKGSTAIIWLNRPEKHNALTIEMISGLLLTLQYLNNTEGVRVIIIRGKGKSFCSGADLNWMQQSSLLSASDNHQECEALARCFYEIYSSPKVTVCGLHGLSMGGAIGLVAASDISVAEENTVFALPEVRVGLLPATVAPYVIGKTGKSRALELMLTGRRFTAAEACQWGLIHHTVAAEKIEDFIDNLVKEIHKGAPQVQYLIKAKLHDNQKLSAYQSVIKETASLLAETRISQEATEGINAFMQKRKPLWDIDIT